MSIAQDILAEFQKTGTLRFPADQVPSVRGDALFSPGVPLDGERVFTFPDESELLVAQVGGTTKVSLSVPYRVRLASAAKAAASGLYKEHVCVALRSDLTFQGKLLVADTVGTIVAVYPDHAAYTVEFDIDGESLLPDLIHTDLKLA